MTTLRNFSSTKALGRALQKALKREGFLLLDRGLLEAHHDFFAGTDFLDRRRVVLPGGEEIKRWSELGQILNALNEAAVERGSTLFVVGGGALCDLGAFAAALYRRGMRLVLVPTTLLAAADAAIGGKTAVDFVNEGRIIKNGAGVFYPAHEVWLCPGWFETLPERERRSGIAEVLKILWLKGKTANYEGWARWGRGEGKLPKSLTAALVQAVKLKQQVVAKDLEDRKGIRAQLNFGHSLGHAIESLAGGRLSHGEAVAWGMWAECEIMGSSFASEIFFVLEGLGYVWPRFLSKASRLEWERLLARDKKMKGGKLELVYLTKLGRPAVSAPTPAKLAQKASELFSKSAVL